MPSPRGTKVLFRRIWRGLGCCFIFKASVAKIYLIKMADTDKKNDTKERTFLMLKPDAVHRGLIADIIKRFEQKGFKLVSLKFTKV